MRPQNLLLIMSDEHRRDASGCYGDAVVQSPNLDALAAAGTRFAHAYCASPICVPSRAALATGRYVHETANWDNAAPYTGAEALSWAHRLSAAGRNVTTIGKLHYRRTGDDTGFYDQRLPTHVAGGVGDLRHLVRGETLAEERVPRKEHFRRLVVEAGEGESEYLRYDRRVTDEAVRWLRHEAHRHDAPWVLKVSYVSPHFPLLAPAPYWNRYHDADVPLPTDHDPAHWPDHPVLSLQRRLQDLDRPVTDEEARRARRAYYALVTFLDEQIGRLLDALAATELGDDTRVVYLSDHGDQLGDHGLWWKSSMYEGAVGVPLVIAGEGIPRGAVCHTNASGIDLFPTVLDMVGVAAAREDSDLRGLSWMSLATEPDHDRPILSEFHSGTAPRGIFMLHSGRYKYVYYAGYEPQLFDLRDDPGEMHDLVGQHGSRAILERCHQQLLAICDPDEVDARARADQQRRVEEAGGEDQIFAGQRMEYTPVDAAEDGNQ